MKKRDIEKLNLSVFPKWGLNKVMSVAVLMTCLLMLSSCLKKDSDKYDPSSINNVSITNSFDKSYTFNVGDTIRLKAIIEQSKPDAQLSYKWYYYSKATSSAPIVEIGDKANLEYPIVTIPQGDYVLTLEVKDIATGVSSFQRTELQVNRSTTEGWLILTNTQGKANLSIVSPANELYRNVLMPSSEYKDLGAAEGLFVLNTTDVGIQPIAFRTSNNMYFLNHDTFEINNTVADAFTTPPGARIMSLFNDLYTQNYYTIDSEGQIYWLRRGLPANVNKNFPTGFSIPLGGNYKARQTAMYSQSSNPITEFFFDEAGKRFICQPASTATRNNVYSVKALAISGQDKAKWDTDNFTDEFIYSEQGNSSLNYIIGKNASGEYSLYTMNDVLFGTTTYPAVVEPQKLTAITPNSDTHLFAFSGKLPLFYYISGQSLYLYNISERRASLLYTFPAGEKPVALKMLRENPSPVVILPLANIQLAVAVNSSTEGILYTFNTTSTGILDGGSFFKRFDRIAPIVSIAYKNKP